MVEGISLSDRRGEAIGREWDPQTRGEQSTAIITI